MIRGATGLLVTLSCCATWGARGAIVYAPPETAADATGELRVLEREIGEGNYPAAARRIGMLLGANRGDALTEFAGTGGTYCTISAWLDRLPPDKLRALAEAQGTEQETAARRMLEAMRATGSVTPEELYGLARRYPLTRTAATALGLAGDRAMGLGDFPSALALYELAVREGFVPDDAREKRIALLRRLEAGDFVAAPADLDGGSAAGARAANGRKILCGAAPFDATWYGNTSAAGMAKFFPAACGDRFVLASAKSVTMLRESGEVVWSAPNPLGAQASRGDRVPASGRGMAFGASILPDLHGRPMIVVVRQPGALGDAQYGMRAFRASDGKLLWTGELGDERWKDLTYAGLPAVSGRYVYSIAAARNERSSGTLVVWAVDVTDGSALWQAKIGSIAEQSIDARGGKKNLVNEPLDLSALLGEVTEPAVADDVVVASPGCGAVIAVGRFDGKVRWVHVYRMPEARAEDFRRERERERDRDRDPGRDRGPGIPVRYRSTPAVCERAVVALPPDSEVIVGMDRRTGNRLWERPAGNAYALAGAVGDVAVVSGTSVAGIDSMTGAAKWRYAPPPESMVTGPAVVAGGTVLVPTIGGVVQLEGVNGEQKSVYRVPHLRKALASETGKAVLREAGAERAVGMPAGAR